MASACRRTLGSQGSDMEHGDPAVVPQFGTFYSENQIQELLNPEEEKKSKHEEKRSMATVRKYITKHSFKSSNQPSWTVTTGS